jgi:uncharacterized membrane protein YkoI
VSDEPRTEPTSAKRLSRGMKIGLIGAGVAAGAVGATAVAAGAATTSPAAATSSAAAPSGSAKPGGDHGSAPVRDDEKSVSASTAATLKAAALKAVPGGTVYRVETDAGDAAYEAHMTKADGSEVTVKFDKSLKVTGVETGMGKGDPAPAGQPPKQH